jgi:hypothetical protein
LLLQRVPIPPLPPRRWREDRPSPDSPPPEAHPWYLVIPRDVDSGHQRSRGGTGGAEIRQHFRIVMFPAI